MAIAFVRNFASLSHGGANSSGLSAPAVTAPIGNCLVVRVLVNGSTVSGITDTKGNTYTKLGEDANQTSTSSLWASVLTTALVSGDTVTITYAAKSSSAQVIDEFSGVAAISLDGAAGVTDNPGSTTPSASVTPTVVPDLITSSLITVTGSSGDTFTEDSDNTGGDTWHSLTALTQATVTAELRGAYKIPTDTSGQTYNPTLGTSRAWALVLAALKGTGASAPSSNARQNLTRCQAVNRASSF